MGRPGVPRPDPNPYPGPSQPFGIALAIFAGAHLRIPTVVAATQRGVRGNKTFILSCATGAFSPVLDVAQAYSSAG